MKRTYETLIEIDADNYDEALDKLGKMDVYTIEMEQCCVTEETFEHEEKPIKSSITIK